MQIRASAAARIGKRGNFIFVVVDKTKEVENVVKTT